MFVEEFIKNPPSEVILAPHPMLKKYMFSKDIQMQNDNVTASQLREVSDIMFHILDKYDTGVGLSANQVGLEYPIFITKYNNKRNTFIYPEIIGSSSKQTYEEEGCLSYPGLIVKVMRSYKIKLLFRDLKDKDRCETYNGTMARIIQHEMNHLIGSTIDEFNESVIQEFFKHTIDIKG